MEHLCVGSYMRIMTSCAIPAERKFDSFCEKIMLSLCPVGAKEFSYTSADGNDVIYTYTNFNKIHSASQNLPTEVMKMALSKDAHDIEQYFISVIIPVLDESRKKNAVLALKDVIIKDGSIADTTQLGTISRFTKNDLKSKNQFILSEFLSDIFIFAAAKTDNITEAAFTRSIKKNFYSLYDHMVDTIELCETVKPKGLDLPPEAKAGENPCSQRLTETDKRLLKEFHRDFDRILKKCIVGDSLDVCFSSGISEEIDRLYNSRWKDHITDFEDISLQSDVLRTIAAMREFCDALNPDSDPISGSPVRKLRMELRNCYVKIHPDEYAGIFPYDAFIDDWNDGEDFFEM